MRAGGVVQGCSADLTPEKTKYIHNSFITELLLNYRFLKCSLCEDSLLVFNTEVILTNNYILAAILSPLQWHSAFNEAIPIKLNTQHLTDQKKHTIFNKIPDSCGRCP